MTSSSGEELVEKVNATAVAFAVEKQIPRLRFAAARNDNKKSNDNGKTTAMAKAIADSLLRSG